MKDSETSNTLIPRKAVRPPPIDFNNIDFERYITTCPSVFGPDNHAPQWLQKNVIEGKEMLLYSLKELNDLYFNDKKLETLCIHRHSTDKEGIDIVTMENCTFYVAIGMKAAYETMFDKPKLNNKSNSPYDSISLKGKGSSSRASKANYEELFVDFFNAMFKRNETDQLEKSYTKENMLTISIFARSAKKTPTNLTRFSDQLIAASSFEVDKIDSILLSWLGVIEKSLSQLEIHSDYEEDNTSFRKEFNIGTFLLIITQVFKSTIQKQWCPIVCQVHYKEGFGPINFYRKNFFFKSNERFQLVYSQFIHRKNSIIYDDPELVWMVLLFPLNDLLMTCIDTAKDWNSYNLILIRGYYYFLAREKNPLKQENIENVFRCYDGSKTDFYA
jgi:hypothetical protein